MRERKISFLVGETRREKISIRLDSLGIKGEVVRSEGSGGCGLKSNHTLRSQQNQETHGWLQDAPMQMEP